MGHTLLTGLACWLVFTFMTTCIWATVPKKWLWDMVGWVSDHSDGAAVGVEFVEEYAKQWSEADEQHRRPDQINFVAKVLIVWAVATILPPVLLCLAAWDCVRWFARGGRW